MKVSSEDLRVHMRGKSVGELRDIAQSSDTQYRAEARAIAAEELATREDEPPLAPDEDGAQLQGPVYFPVSTTKLVLLSFTTFGLYEAYWFYKQRSFEENHTNDHSISPGLRTGFTHTFAFSLFGRVSSLSETPPFKHLPHFSHSESVACGAAYFLLILSSQLPGTLSLLSLLRFLPLLVVQRAINGMNKVHAPDADSNGKFSVANIIAVLFGGILVILVVMVNLMPATPN